MLVDFSPKNPSVGILKAVFDMKTEDKITWQDHNVWNKIESLDYNHDSNISSLSTDKKDD